MEKANRKKVNFIKEIEEKREEIDPKHLLLSNGCYAALEQDLQGLVTGTSSASNQPGWVPLLSGHSIEASAIEGFRQECFKKARKLVENRKVIQEQYDELKKDGNVAKELKQLELELEINRYDIQVKKAEEKARRLEESVQLVRNFYQRSTRCQTEEDKAAVLLLFSQMREHAPRVCNTINEIIAESQEIRRREVELSKIRMRALQDKIEQITDKINQLQYNFKKEKQVFNTCSVS